MLAKINPTIVVMFSITLPQTQPNLLTQDNAPSGLALALSLCRYFGNCQRFLTLADECSRLSARAICHQHYKQRKFIFLCNFNKLQY